MLWKSDWQECSDQLGLKEMPDQGADCACHTECLMRCRLTQAWRRCGEGVLTVTATLHFSERTETNNTPPNVQVLDMQCQDRRD